MNNLYKIPITAFYQDFKIIELPITTNAKINIINILKYVSVLFTSRLFVQVFMRECIFIFQLLKLRIQWLLKILLL